MSQPKDVDATNRDFIRYDQVHKRQSYHLSESDHGEAFDEEYELKTCDLSRFLEGSDADKKAFARELGDALHEIGFAILVGHGIDASLHDRAHEDTERLFTETRLEEKLSFRGKRHGSVNQGYFPIKETSDIHPDLVEGWVFCRRAFDITGDGSVHAGDFWPIAELEPRFRELCLAQQRLIHPIAQALLTFLGCDPHHLDRALTGTNFGLRLNYYPPVPKDAESEKAARLLGHEDVDLFTLLPAPRVEGLQVLNHRNMKWVRLKAPSDGIILNTGDYMQRISNDILPSTTHRVSPPRDPSLRESARTSFPMNVYLWEHEVLEVLPGTGAPRYEPVEALRFHTRITSKYYGDDYAVEK